ncbi:MAG: acetyl-CoA decarbonylase/synthase complex subunit delta [Chloroflexi bacterium]|nr:acetyl-CoA decarbonylase/synthase complex subunit delta [Chloroflexota bacterium]
MPVAEVPIEKWSGKVRELRLGDNGRKHVIVGGETTLPFLHFDGTIPNPPVIAIEVHDQEPSDWTPNLASAWGDALKTPVAWAKKAVEFGADIIYLYLKSAHPEEKNAGAAEAAATVSSVLEATDVPIIVIGPGIADKDNEVLVAAADAARGQRIALGNCVEKNYRTIAAAAIANGHACIAQTPIEINLAKQLNILLSDMGISPDSIMMDPTTGALGYGLEYVYSVMERLRLAALQGDAMTAMPIINSAGEETWRQKEAKFSEGVPEAWGDQQERALFWEQLTASTVLAAGSDIVVLRHPRTVEVIRSAIARLMAR